MKPSRLLSHEGLLTWADSEDKKVFQIVFSSVFVGLRNQGNMLGLAEKPMRRYYFGHVGLRSQEDVIAISFPDVC